MSSAYVLVAFAVCILLMILFISKWKIHPVTSILVATIILAISIGTPWDKIEGIINKGMADTLKSIAIVIVLGCILGKVLEETGAAVSITKATVKLFGEKRVLWAILLASAILGIPIWADTVVILLIPIVSNLALQTNKSMMSYGTALYMGALVTASLVPPTPGPVAAAALLHLPLSDAIMWGVLISIPSVFAAGLYCLTLKEPVAPQDEYIKSAEASKDKPLPSVGTSLAPIILPLVLIFLNTGINAMFPDTTVAKVFKFVGSPLAALLAGCLFSLVLTGAEWRSKKVMNAWVESALRSSAKAVNFGIVYGIGAFSLSKDIAVSVKEADAFIKNYLATFPGVKQYMDGTIAQGREQGYVTTLFGRRRALPELASKNFNLRALGERMAMNTPIQGTAADVIKLAMVKVWQRLRAEKLEAKLILQVHDELIVEAPKAEAKAVCRILQEEMQNVVEFAVPLTADVNTGKTWLEAH